MSASISQDPVNGANNGYDETSTAGDPDNTGSTSAPTADSSADEMDGAASNNGTNQSSGAQTDETQNTATNPDNTTADTPETSDTLNDVPEEYTSQRDELLRQLQDQYEAAKSQWSQSQKTNDKTGMQEAVEQVVEVVVQAQPPADEFQQKQQDDKVRREQAKYAQLTQDTLATLKQWRAQTSKKAATKGTPEAMKNFLNKLTGKINETFRRKAEGEQRRSDGFFRNSLSKLSQLTQIKKDANAKATAKQNPDTQETPENASPLTDAERAGYEKEAAAADFDGVAGDQDLTTRERAKVKPGERQFDKMTAKALKHAAEKREFEKTRETAKTDAANADETTEGADTARVANDSVKTPDAQQLRATIGALREAGLLTQKNADKLLDKLAKKQAMTMQKGAGIMAARNDAEENTAVRDALALHYRDEEEETDSASEEKPKMLGGFRLAMVGLTKSLSQGTLRRDDKVAERWTNVADKTYNGETAERGQLDYSRMMTTNSMPYSSDDETPMHVAHMPRLNQELAEKGQVLNARFVSTVDQGRVG